MDSKQDRIRQRAYEIWEAEGRDGDHEGHWHRASQEIANEDASESDGGEIATDDSATGTVAPDLQNSGGTASGDRSPTGASVAPALGSAAVSRVK